jgi:two-component system LytT family sensor kinase
MPFASEPVIPANTSGARRWSRLAAFLLPPALCLVAALVSSARGGMMIDAQRVAHRMPWSEIFIGALYDFAWWMPLGALIVFIVRRLGEVSAPLPRRVLAHVASGVGICTLYFWLRAGIHLPGETTRIGLHWRGFLSQLPSSVGMYLVIASAAGLVVALGHARVRERDAAALALRASRLETQLVDAQLGILRAQLHPHFLFNSLHAVSALVDWRPKEARRMLVHLSDLLRMALDFTELTEITVAREMEWLEHYLELQHLRFADRLHVDVRVIDDAATGCVPPLILQPLVENAVKHGIESRTSGGRIEIVVERDGSWLRLRVRDDGPGVTENATHSGVGLRNTRERLRTIYGDGQRVVLRSMEGGGTEALVELPWKSASTARQTVRAG